MITLTFKRCCLYCTQEWCSSKAQVSKEGLTSRETAMEKTRPWTRKQEFYYQRNPSRRWLLKTHPQLRSADNSKTFPRWTEDGTHRQGQAEEEGLCLSWLHPSRIKAVLGCRMHWGEFASSLWLTHSWMSLKKREKWAMKYSKLQLNLPYPGIHSVALVNV